MDVDWCLSCERRIDDFSRSLSPYCSPECLTYAQPMASSSSIQLNRIRQWAQGIPPNEPAGAPSHPFARQPISAPNRPPSPPHVAVAHTPKLITRTSATTPLPTLCVSSPASAHVPRTPSPRPSPALSRAYTNETATASVASTSLTSLLSEPLISTPDDCPQQAGLGITALVKSWVHPGIKCSTGCTKEDHHDDAHLPAVVEAKFFSPQPSPTTKSKHIAHSPQPSPAPVRRKLAIKKFEQSYDITNLTPKHTPTPVVFPSCRAGDLEDWDDEEEEDRFLPPQHVPKYEQAYLEESRWRRPVSLSSSNSSVSSTGSSMLVMKAREHQWDAARGRRGGQAIRA
ncbi:hypothetical protein BJ138DRAFT_1082382 [Hygrophoropsis aurantiaca]|uniref:Uncharacterized protein n=1 Tax=Hygrophoropsis aurantiaca TaxID=72124 RepID=A0ACB8AJF5_9AGAM|nr:hypothetical protein BJ138DRAFT_1082382 [Hygrophoropsis aurantiaca]